MLIVSAALGGLLSALLGHLLGSRRMLILLALPDLTGWVLIASSPSLSLLLAGRLLTGIAAGGYFSNIQIYVAEICQARHRGWLAGLTMPVMATGVLAIHASDRQSAKLVSRCCCCNNCPSTSGCLCIQVVGLSVLVYWQE